MQTAKFKPVHDHYHKESLTRLNSNTNYNFQVGSEWPLYNDGKGSQVGKELKNTARVRALLYG